MKHPDAHDIVFFEGICPDRVFTGEEIKEDYTHDEMKIYGAYTPDIVIEAETTEEVSEIMAYCYENNIPVTPRGMGTGLCGGCAALYGGVLLSLVRMNKILEIDRRTMTATVEAGLLLMDLIEILSKENLFYPPDPGEKSATLGGNVMTNAGGMRAVRFGVTRDYVHGLTAVKPDGTILRPGGKLTKNSSGYSVKDILVGSEGTLAVVTEIILKIMPQPGVGQSALVPFSGIGEAIAVVPDIISSGLNLTAVEFMQKEVIELVKEYLGKSFPDTKAPAYLLLSIDSEEESIDRQMKKLAALLLELGAEDVYFADTDERKDSLWIPRGAFLEAIKSSAKDMDECDVVVPIDRINDYVTFLSELSASSAVRINYFGHAGDGNLHVYICYDDGDKKDWQKKCDQIMDQLYDKALSLGGQVSGEHGIGHAKVKYLKHFISDAELEIMRGIKQVFDPKHILNPSKVL